MAHSRDGILKFREEDEASPLGMLKTRGKAGEGVAERREPSFNFLLAAA